MNTWWIRETLAACLFLVVLGGLCFFGLRAC